MALRLITAPTEEPISLPEAKEFLRVDYDDQDLTISSLIKTARELVEIGCRRQLMTATWMVLRDRFPCRVGPDRRERHTIFLPFPPVQSVTFVKYTDSAGALQTIDTSTYQADIYGEPGRVRPAYASFWPFVTPRLNGIQVQFVCGYASASLVPERAKQAMRLLMSHWYENREETVERQLYPIPTGAKTLIDSLDYGAYMEAPDDTSDDRLAAWSNYRGQGVYA